MYFQATDSVYYIKVYAFISVAGMLNSFITTLSTVIGLVIAARKLFYLMLRNIIHMPMRWVYIWYMGFRPCHTIIIYEITNLWKFELNQLSELPDSNERKKHPCHTKLCAFWCLISRPQILNLRSQNSWKITYFSKTTLLQREPFLTMFYTINLSPLLVTK